MLKNKFKLLVVIIFFFPIQIKAQNKIIEGIWKLEVNNVNGARVTIVNVEFTDIASRSCLGGNWKQVKFNSINSSDVDFFPVKQKISYKINQGKLIIGRNGRCDSYLHLTGSFIGNGTKGDYIAFGPDHNKVMGNFLLRSNK